MFSVLVRVLIGEIDLRMGCICGSDIKWTLSGLLCSESVWRPCKHCGHLRGSGIFAESSLLNSHGDCRGLNVFNNCLFLYGVVFEISKLLGLLLIGETVNKSQFEHGNGFVGLLKLIRLKLLKHTLLKNCS